MNFKNREEMTYAHNIAFEELRYGVIEPSITVFEALVTQLPVPGYLNNLGIAYAINNRWELAVTQFEHARSSSPNNSGNPLVGLAKWCLGRREDACHDWNEELERIKSKSIIYTDAGGGVTPAVLLWWASCFSDLKHWRPAAVTALKRIHLAKKARPCWPSPMASYLLLKIDNEELARLGAVYGVEVPEYILAQIRFSRACLFIDANDEVAYANEMAQIANQPIPRIIGEEYLLACYETKERNPDFQICFNVRPTNE